MLGSVLQVCSLTGPTTLPIGWIYISVNKGEKKESSTSFVGLLKLGNAWGRLKFTVYKPGLPFWWQETPNFLNPVENEKSLYLHIYALCIKLIEEVFFIYACVKMFKTLNQIIAIASIFLLCVYLWWSYVPCSSFVSTLLYMPSGWTESLESQEWKRKVFSPISKAPYSTEFFYFWDWEKKKCIFTSCSKILVITAVALKYIIITSNKPYWFHY